MGNGIEKIIVDNYVPSMKRALESEKNIVTKYTNIDVIVLYDNNETVFIANKKDTNFQIYPEYNIGRIVIRPFRDLKSSMFDYDGRVFIRFTYKLNEEYQQITKELGLIINDVLKPNNNYDNFEDINLF